MKNKSSCVLADFAPGMLVTPARSNHACYGEIFRVESVDRDGGAEGRVICSDFSIFIPGDLQPAEPRPVIILEPEVKTCRLCGSPVRVLGSLGRRAHGRCEACGFGFSWKLPAIVDFSI